MNRREFLQRSSVIAGAVCLDAKAFAQTVSTLGKPNLIIGVLSDIHIRDVASAETFVHALEYYRDLNIDGLILAGDLADWGLESQLQVVADSWYKVFPDDKLPSGAKVEKLFIYGNHDAEGYTWGRPDSATAQAQAIGLRKEEVWKTCFREDYAPIWIKSVKGYQFIGAHWNKGNIPGLKQFLEAHATELSGSKPFFYIQHPHLKNTCNGPWAWGQDDGTSTKIFSKYPNAIAFSGHSHSPLNDDRDLWQDSFTSIGTASLSYLYPMPARENTYQDDSSIKPPYQMKNMDCSDGRQGMVMRIYDDCITFERREFVYDQEVDSNWILPWPISSTKPLTFENRSKTAPIPQFDADAQATVTIARGADRYGKVQTQATVHFPNVLKKNNENGVRAFDFEVQVEYQWLDVVNVVGTKRVFSPHCYLGEAQDEGEVICIFGEDELPKERPFRFAIRPCECFGKKGNPIYTDWMDTASIVVTSSIKTSKKYFRLNEDIVIDYQGAPVGTEAWIGLYAAGTNPGSGSPSKAFQYTSAKDGQLTFSLGVVGEYYAVLFKDGGYQECSARIPILVINRSYDETAFAMDTDKLAYPVGAAVTLNLKDAPFMSKDWVGMYTHDCVPQSTTCPSWLYCSGTKDKYVLNANGTRNWTSPLPEGVYFVGYFCCDGYTEPFPRKYFTIGQPVSLSATTSNPTIEDEVFVQTEEVPTMLPCRLCWQKQGESQWHEVCELTKRSESVSLGRLEAGTYSCRVLIGDTPVSPECLIIVSKGSAIGRVSQRQSDGTLYRLDGTVVANSDRRLPRGIYIKDGNKILR